MRHLLSVLVLTLFVACAQKPNSESEAIPLPVEDSIFTTPLGKIYPIPVPNEAALANFEQAKQEFEANPKDVEALIWYGRRAAYLGRYRQAIAIYTEGIKNFPQDARLYRHRGHRYISIRNYEAAIADLEKAASLIQGTVDQIEPDGMPNAQNIPLSSLHSNVWYHLGLAYYLSQHYEKAYSAYIQCRESGNNYDNIVSSTHWLYLIQLRLGNPERADSLLAPIQKAGVVIENQSYADLCQLYKGWISPDTLLQASPGNPSNDAVNYGLANWYLHQGDSSKGIQLLEALLAGKAFTSFGYLAAEGDLMHYFSKGHQK
ncbi:MAG: tetratricopeptide repeat protein [Algoriphagus sp.]|nr:tetratricopeptide repeat protein [Algoriphagus sp.]